MTSLGKIRGTASPLRALVRRVRGSKPALCVNDPAERSAAGRVLSQLEFSGVSALSPCFQCSGGSDQLCLQRSPGHRPAERAVPAHGGELPSAAEHQGRLLYLPQGEVNGAEGIPGEFRGDSSCSPAAARFSPLCPAWEVQDASF